MWAFYLLIVVAAILFLLGVVDFIRRFIGEGYEDENGFHDGSEEDAD